MKQIEIESFLQFQHVSNPTFSPDGASAAFLVKEANAERSGYTSDLYLLNIQTRENQRLTTEGDVKSYLWTPEGKLLFPSLRDAAKRELVENGEELTCYYELDPADGSVHHAFDLPLEGASLDHIRDNLYLVYATHDLQRPDTTGMTAEERTAALKEHRNPGYHTLLDAPYWGNGIGFTSGKRTRMYLYDRDSDLLKAITVPTFHAVDPRFGAHIFSVRGTKILYKGFDWPGGLQPFYPGVFLYDYVTGENRCLIPQDTVSTSCLAFWDDRQALLGSTDKSKGPLQFDEFYTLDVETGERKLLTPYEHSVNALSVNTDAKLGGGRGIKLVDDVFYFVTTINDGSYIRSISKDGTLSDLLTPDGASGDFDYQNGHLLVCAMYGNKLNELYLDGEQVTHFNDAYAREYSIIEPDRFRFHADSDGTEIHCWTLKPLNYEPGHKYPAILHIHGGPCTVFGDIYHHEMQVWANAGYFVLYCNPRGSDGRGNEFADLAGKYGTVDYTDLMQFVDECLKRYPDIDPHRLGVAGGSYGGFMTNWIIGHNDRFAAAVSMRSISNWVTQEHLSDIGPQFTKFEQLATTRDNVEKLWDVSPLKYAAACKTPTLFIHGDMDQRCWMAEGLSMYTALQLIGCPTKLCLFHGENHELSRSGSPKNRISRMKEILSWMDQYLK